MVDNIEVPFPPDPECILTWEDSWPEDAIGWITFVSPCTGFRGLHRTSLPVTRKPGGYEEHDGKSVGPVWEFRRDGDVISTHPSIEAVCCNCHWHSPNPVFWRLVDDLPV